MGRTSHLTPGGFARDLHRFLWALIEPLGADASGRWLEARTNGARSRDYWRKITTPLQAMTTNDIEVLAKLFEISSYDFVRGARVFAETGRITVGDDYALAASDDPDWQERQEREAEWP